MFKPSVRHCFKLVPCSGWFEGKTKGTTILTRMTFPHVSHITFFLYALHYIPTSFFTHPRCSLLLPSQKICFAAQVVMVALQRMRPSRSHRRTWLAFFCGTLCILVFLDVPSFLNVSPILGPKVWGGVLHPLNGLNL